MPSYMCGPKKVQESQREEDPAGQARCHEGKIIDRGPLSHSVILSHDFAKPNVDTA